MSDIDVGIALPNIADPDTGAARAAHVLDGARAVEEVGLDHVSLPDVVLGDGSPGADPLVLASAVAVRTSRVRLEFGVLVTSLRPLALLAAQLATLQHVSDGRLVLGLGVGGFPDAPLWRAADAVTGPARTRRLVAALDLLPGLLRGEPTAITQGGDPVTLAPAAPVPPLLVGGGLGARVRERVVTHADGWLPSLRAPSTLATAVTELRTLAAERGRPRPRVRTAAHAALGPDAAERAAAFRDAVAQGFGLEPADLAAMPVLGPADRLAERLDEYAAAGAESMTLVLDGPDWRTQLDVVADAKRRLTRE